MESTTYAEHASKDIAGNSGTEYRGPAIETVDGGAEEIEDGVATGTPRDGSSSADGRCQEPDQSATFSSSPTGQLAKSPQGVQSSTGPTASNGGRNFLEVSLERWQGYTEDFRKQDQELQAKIKEAQDAVQQSIERFQECQSATGVAADTKEKETVEVSDDDTEMVTSARVEETMEKMSLLSRCKR